MTRKVVLPQSYPVFIKSDGLVYWIGWAKDIDHAAVICNGFPLVTSGALEHTIVVDVEPVDMKIGRGQVPRPDIVSFFRPDPSIKFLEKWGDKYYLLDLDSPRSCGRE